NPPTGKESAKVVLVGNPNVGKSVIFNYLTGAYRVVSNYPGTTVEVSSGSAVFKAGRYTVLDTPGINNLIPNSEDEKVTRDILLSEQNYSVISVLDGKNIKRGLMIVLQLVEMGLPLLVVVNMIDEARSRGIDIQVGVLEEVLGVPVLPTVATRKKGLEKITAHLSDARRSPFTFRYSPDIEEAVAALLPLIPQAAISGRSLALMLLSGDETLRPWLEKTADPAAIRELEEVCSRFQSRFSEPLGYRINVERLARVEALLPAVFVKGREKTRHWGPLLAAWSTHRVYGWLGLALVLYLSYWIIGVLGAEIAVEFMEEVVFGTYVNPWITRWFKALVPVPFLQDLVVGNYGILTMALTYALALILPIVTFFFLIFGFLEDSGYLPRLAVMTNRIFRLMGLNGKAILPMILGLGCDTMATMTTRILETPKDKIIVTLLLALGVPCSAQLAVVLGMLSGFSIWVILFWVAIIAGVIILVGFLAARVIPGESTSFILELPPLRWPQMSNILLKTLSRLEWYLQEAVPLFILGTLVLFALDKTGALATLEREATPLVVWWLGLPAESTGSFIIGFLRRDYGAAGFFNLARQGLLTQNQILVALVTITLFVPCIANFFVIIKERGWKVALAIVGTVIGIALLVGGLLNWALFFSGWRIS
ncbi:MAG: ferrous iron transport protein B, partial [Desulfobacterota bacterium]|nr:ferrous iron transport protein B [Thermodesulfobacteriota bacterium]